MRLGRRSTKGLLAGAILAAILGGAALAEAPKAQPPKTPPAPPEPKSSPVPTVLHLLPRAHRLSTYSISARYEMTTKDVTFDAPAAYKEGFDFWAKRMKGQRRSEVYEITSITQDADAQGRVPFRLMIPKFDLESERDGEILTVREPVVKSVTTLVFEGVLDPLGNVKELKQTAGEEDPEIGDLAIQEVVRVFPEVDGPRDLQIGDSFRQERIIQLPSKLTISGLEDVTLKVIRDYVLKSIQGGLATFEIRTTYADDPAFKPRAENTACHVSGGGSGEAVFLIGRGVYDHARIPTTMRLDVEAPLRPLPNHPETQKPTTGKTHIELGIMVSGQQTVKRTWGEEQD